VEISKSSKDLANTLPLANGNVFAKSFELFEISTVY